MSRADHPAGRALTCASTGCTGRAAARVTSLPGVAMIRPASAINAPGQLLCLDCAHTAVDVMLLRATPEPSR